MQSSTAPRVYVFVAAVALIKAAAALMALAATAASPPLTSTTAWQVFQVVAFGLVAIALVLFPPRERRALILGVLFALICSVFSDPFLARLAPFPGRAGGVTRIAAASEVDAFIAYFLWLFVQDFPRVPERHTTPRFAQRITTLSLAAGALLFAANLAALIPSLPQSWNAILWMLSRRNITSLYWPVVYISCALAIGYMLWRTWLAAPDERRRVNVAIWGIAAGAGPMVLWTIGTSVSPAVSAALPLSAAGWVIYPSLLLCPVAVAYAVVVDKALDVRLIIRGAIQYALARYSLMTAAALPVLLIAIHAYRYRSESADAVLFTERTALLLTTSFVITVLLGSRRGILDRIDRRFFRTEYDAQHVMRQLIDNCRWAGTSAELAAILAREIDTALHPSRVDVLLLDPSRNRFASALDRLRPLSSASGIIGPLQRSEQAVDLTLERESSIARTLTADDQHWLADSDCRYLLPLRTAAHTLLGFIALGEKKSELPYTRNDWSLLTAAAASAEMAISFHAPMATGPQAVDAERDAAEAVECTTCGLVLESGVPRCPKCGGACNRGVLPRMLVGKYELEARIGAGGMGVVYRATDVHLDRVIAIKTLPYASPDGAMRMRREAKAMARVSHPHLAQIFGAESWKGYPLLLVEYLAGGTLADRLAAGQRLTLDEAIALGSSITDALGALHAAGILHRDIKPSNIGFSGVNFPKLLDFGIADAGGAAPDPVNLPGTLVYMAPEVVSGAIASPAQDTWALALTLYEAVTGANPMAGGTYEATRERVLAGAVPDIREFTPDVPADAAEFFRHALASRPDERMQTAAALGARLELLSSTSALAAAA